MNYLGIGPRFVNNMSLVTNDENNGNEFFSIRFSRKYHYFFQESTTISFKKVPLFLSKVPLFLSRSALRD